MDISAGALVMMLLTGSIGFGLFVYGKKQARMPQLVTGMALMGFPYLVTDAWWMLASSVALLAGMWMSIRAGL